MVQLFDIIEVPRIVFFNPIEIKNEAWVTIEEYGKQYKTEGGIMARVIEICVESNRRGRVVKAKVIIE